MANITKTESIYSFKMVAEVSDTDALTEELAERIVSEIERAFDSDYGQDREYVFTVSKLFVPLMKSRPVFARAILAMLKRRVDIPLTLVEKKEE